MQKKIFVTVIALFLGIAPRTLNAQKKQEVNLNLTLEQSIELARKQSIASFRYKNMYLAKYWEFRSYKADRLPGLKLSASPFTYNQSYEFDQSLKKYVPDQSLTSTGNLSLSQNLAFSGGSVSIVSSLQRYNNLENDDLYFRSQPLSIVLSQPINGYNTFRWDARIEPLKFEVAKREFVQSVEDVAISANQYFFNTVSAEINLKIAETNYHNADTLFRIAKGRFEIGTVTQDELLDFELSFLNAKIDQTKANLSLRQARSSLNSFLGLDDHILVTCIIPYNIPQIKIDLDNALELSLENNPNIIEYEQQLLEAKRSVASARATSGLDASVRANLGLNKTAGNFNDSYRDPFDDNRSIGISLSVPILDWGSRHGKIQMAKSNKEVTEAAIRQSRIDFEQNVFQQVMEFNLQDEQVEIAAKADTIAQMGYDVTKQRFMIDKVDVIKLNSARNSLDAAKRNYVDALKRYWTYYYTIRKLTLFDFEKKEPLMQSFDKLIEQP
ncbi:MAG: TolC family protein [Breznakibacter sp.]